jgi:hypothetical protein
MRGGTIRTRIRAQGADSYSGPVAGVVRVFINGVAVGSEVASPPGNAVSSVLQQDFTVNAGDIVALGVRASSAMGISAFGIINIGLSSVFQYPSIVTQNTIGGQSGNTFSI